MPVDSSYVLKHSWLPVLRFERHDRGQILSTDRPCKAALRYWVPRIDAIRPDGLRSFRGFYTILFRQHSGLVHATMRGLNHVSVDLEPPRKRIVMEDPAVSGNGPYGMATVIYGVGLLVAAQSLGWPESEQVEQVFTRFP